MWHTMTFVAESRRIDADGLQAFACEHVDRYRIVTENGQTLVNTWYVDELVINFKASIAGDSMESAKKSFAECETLSANVAVRSINIDKDGE